jgi:LmbE family N-acetylglucosaminyl deacetylase
VEREERVRELAALLDRLRPALILTPFVTDVHADHRVLSRMRAREITAGRAVVGDTEVLGYQVWSAAPAGVVCDVTGEAELQERALMLYATAMKVDDYVHFCQDRNYHDALAVAGRPGFVECFFATPARGFPELTATAEGFDG